MNEIKLRKPFALFMRRDEIRRILPIELELSKEGNNTDLFGVILDIKALDKIDNPKIFMEYCIGKEE